MLIDTHCHLTFDDLSPQVDAVLQRARQAGVSRLITVGTTVAEARDALALMESRPWVFLAAGIHNRFLDLVSFQPAVFNARPDDIGQGSRMFFTQFHSLGQFSGNQQAFNKLGYLRQENFFPPQIKTTLQHNRQSNH